MRFTFSFEEKSKVKDWGERTELEVGGEEEGGRERGRGRGGEGRRRERARERNRDTNLSFPQER